MRTAEDSTGTVLHRLIQEQLRYGNLTDTRTLLAIQQQALRGGSSNSSGGGGGAGSPRSSLESLNLDESQYVHMSKRQEPQGQEHKGDSTQLLEENQTQCPLYQFHGEQLPTYEEAKVHSQYLICQQGLLEEQEGPGVGAGAAGSQSAVAGQWDWKREHTRSLSERLLQLSLERNGQSGRPALSPSHSFPQLHSQSLATSLVPDRPGSERCPDQRGPPPDYPVLSRLPGYMVSHSQEHVQYCRDPPPPFYPQQQQRQQQQQQQHRFVFPSSQVPHNGVVSATAAVVSNSHPTPSDALMQENVRLRKELEAYMEKAARLQKMELEIQRISEAYETLMKGSAKRESLEKAMRNKLEAEIKRMHDFNRDLREQLDTANKQRAAREAQSSDQRQNVFIRLLEQSEEQQRERDRLEKQLQQLRLSDEECQRKRELLERALASAQGHNRQLEEELQRKRAYVEKVERLQSALAQLQAACEKRDTLELRLRTRLEQELKSLRAQQSQSQTADLTATELSSSALRLQLREKEERILALEADITKWEQKYLEESTMRQFAMDAAATAAAQRDTTIIKHSPRHSPDSSFNEDLPLSGHRHQEMENRIRALHARLLEKDAVIKVLQQRSRWEQGKRLARSVPSINTATNSSLQTRGKSLSDDQTGLQARGSSSSSSSSAAPKRPSQDRSTQSESPAPQDTLPAVQSGGLETSEALLAAGDETPEELQTMTSSSTGSSDADVVEILI